jgi:hypothetical protein
MTFSPEIEAFIAKFVDELEDNNVAVFGGAGLSVTSGHVNWKGLLKEIADKLGLDIEKEEGNLVSVSQYFLNENQNNRHELNQKILNEFRGKVPNENHHILARLPISTYWTTNYDKLIEKSLESSGKIVDVKYTNLQLANTVDGRNAVVYKMHGDVDNPNDAVLSKDQYERYFQTHPTFISALSGDLTSKTFLFIGFSFTDPNLDYIFGRIRVTFAENQRSHYCFFKQIEPDNSEDEEVTEYRRLKQALVIKDLLRFNIHVLEVDSYPQVTEILREIENRYRRKTIFISGSAHEYGRWSNSDAEVFITNLSKAIVQNGFRIVSGFGLGVGSFVINGVLEEVYLEKQQNLGKELLLRPFPQGEKGQEQWEQYRRDMISYAGIAVILFGNKLHENKTVLANGVRAEFQIARDLGLIPIPIASTGYMAKEIYDELVANSGTVYEGTEWVVPMLEDLASDTSSSNDLIEKTVAIIKRLQE